jgi:hypothetical protein
MTDLQMLLLRCGACREARDWAGSRTLAEVWADCQRSDWLLWLLGAIGYDDERVLRLFAAWCARQVLHLVDDPRSREAVEVAERYARGEATREELAAAWAAANAAAWDACAAANAAVWAAEAAARVAAWDAAAWDAAEAARYAARYAAEAAASATASAAEAAEAAAWDAWSSAYASARAAQAARLREVVPLQTVAELAAEAMAATLRTTEEG